MNDHDRLMKAIADCEDLQELERLLDICVERAQERLKKYDKYLSPKKINKEENISDNS